MNPRLIQILADTLGIEAAGITQETAMANTPQWDSVAHLNVCLSVEETFGVKLSPEEMIESTTAVAIEEVLRRHGAA